MKANPSFTHDLLREHRTVLSDQTEFEEVPVGWEALVTILVDTMAGMLADAGTRIGVVQIKEKMAALRVYLDTGDLTVRDQRLLDRLNRLVSAAEQASTHVCDACGLPGRVRVRGGFFAARCLSCAPKGSKPINPALSSRGVILVSDPPDGGGPAAGTFKASLCLAHRSWLRDEAPDTDVPDDARPWVTAVLALVGELVIGVAGRRKVRYVLRRLVEPDGSPAVDVAPRHVGREPSDGLVTRVTASALSRANRVRGGDADAPDGGRAATPPADAAAPDARGREERIALYAVDDVAAALGESSLTFDPDGPPDNEHRARVRQILERGDEARWRALVHPSDGAIRAVERLGARSPHLDEVTRLVGTHLRAAMRIGTPTALPPLLLVGEPGVGKSWYLGRLAEALGVPFRTYHMNASSLSEGLSGSHPSWRCSGTGLVATTLLREQVANPVVFVDEMDKASGNSANADPYRSLYTLLEPADARRHVDEFLGFAIDASRVIWIMAANSAAELPPPIVDRLTIVHVPPPDETARAAVARSIYSDANEARRRFFAEEPDGKVLARLVGMSARSMRIAIEGAMVRAAAGGRDFLSEDDLPTERGQARRRMGFI